MSVSLTGGATASPLYIRPGPTATPMSANARQAASHGLVPVAPGQGMLSKEAAVIATLDLVNGVDQATGHGGHMKLSQAYNRNAGTGRPGGVGAAESLGPMSGPMKNK